MRTGHGSSASIPRPLEPCGSADCGRRALRREKTLALAPEKRFPPETRPRRASAHFAHPAPRRVIAPAASDHRRNRDHQKRVAEGFESGGEISAAVCRLIVAAFVRTRLMFAVFSQIGRAHV